MAQEKDEVATIELDERIDLNDFDGLLFAYREIVLGYCKREMSATDAKVLRELVDSARHTLVAKQRTVPKINQPKRPVQPSITPHGPFPVVLTGGKKR